MIANLRCRIAKLPRVELIKAPTPLEHWQRLSEKLGVSLFVKREDVGGIGLGGNKLRKLEFLLGKARQEGATWVLTTGGPQSNHARLTAAAAAKYGLGCTLFLRGKSEASPAGNLLLDYLFGADVKLLGDVDYAFADQAMANTANELRIAGHRPVTIPLGGATAEGTAAYVEAFTEIAEQHSDAGRTPDFVVVAAGTGSTYAGLVFGAHIVSFHTKVIGISVSWTQNKLESESRRIINEVETLLETQLASQPEHWIEAGFIGSGYSQVSVGGLTAVKLAARTEGVLLDTTYTGKAFAGLIDLVQCGTIPAGSNVTFIHTGGTPELYCRDSSELLSA